MPNATAHRIANAYPSTRLGVNEIEELSNRVRSLLDMTKGPPQGFVNKLSALGNLAKIARYQPKLIKKAPCQDVVITGDEVDLFKFPILRCWPLDGGRTITFPLVITKNPMTGKRNVGTYRMQVYDKRTTGMHWQTHKVGAEHYRRSTESGLKRMDVAGAIGVDPTTVWTGSAQMQICAGVAATTVAAGTFRVGFSSAGGGIDHSPAIWGTGASANVHQYNSEIAPGNRAGGTQTLNTISGTSSGSSATCLVSLQITS